MMQGLLFRTSSTSSWHNSKRSTCSSYILRQRGACITYQWHMHHSCPTCPEARAGAQQRTTVETAFTTARGVPAREISTGRYITWSNNHGSRSDTLLLLRLRRCKASHHVGASVADAKHPVVLHSKLICHLQRGDAAFEKEAVRSFYLCHNPRPITAD